MANFSLTKHTKYACTLEVSMATVYMAGNFRGVPIFVIFVVDLQSRNFPPPKINAHRYMHIDEGHGQKHHGSVATCSLC